MFGWKYIHTKKLREPVKNFLADFFLNGIGGTPPPLNGKSLCPKKLSGMGGGTFLAHNQILIFWGVCVIDFLIEFSIESYIL